MSTEVNKALMLRVFEEVYNQRNPAILDELCVPDLVFHNASFTMQGLQAIKPFVLLFLAAFPGPYVLVGHSFGGLIVRLYT
jgi:pimeloyl-ACP methyl ester carboxylesterase